MIRALPAPPVRMLVGAPLDGGQVPAPSLRAAIRAARARAGDAPAHPDETDGPSAPATR